MRITDGGHKLLPAILIFEEINNGEENVDVRIQRVLAKESEQDFILELPKGESI